MPSKYVYKKKILNKHRLNNLYKGNNNTDIVVFIDIPSKKKSIKLLEQYKDKILGSCVFDIYDKIVQIKHLNYLNKLENLDKILSVLTQHHNLIWLHLSIKSINDELLQACVDNNFKDIYISNVSLDNKSISTSLCMKYDKKKDDSDQFQLAKNLLKQYNTNKQYCTANATFKLKTAKYLKNLVYDPKYKNEVAGEVYLNGFTYQNGEIIFNIDIDSKDVSKGDKDEVDIIMSLYNFHTHPKNAYKIFNCELGWPSADDFSTYLYGLIKFNTIFHFISTMEGVYVISINKEMVPKVSKWTSTYYEKEVEPWIISNLNVDKLNYRKNDGIYHSNHNIIDEESYVKCINNIKFKGDTIFNVVFLNWDDILNPDLFVSFKFYYPKQKGSCHLEKK